MSNDIESGLIQDVRDLDPKPLSASAGDATDTTDQKTPGDSDNTDTGDSDGTDNGDSDGTDSGDSNGTDKSDSDGTDNA